MMTTRAPTPASATATRATLAARRATSIRGARCARPTRAVTLQRGARAARVEIACSATKTAHSYSHTNKKGLSEYVERASARQTKRDLIPFRVGMTLKVGVTVKEGNKTRVQPFEGVVIGIHRAGVATTVTVRKTLQGFGVERVFPVHSPLCTFEEVRGAGKPVVRILSNLDARERRRRRDAGRARRRDETRARITLERARTTDVERFLLHFSRAGSPREIILPAPIGGQTSAPEDALRVQARGHDETRDQDGSHARRGRARARAAADAEAAAAAAAEAAAAAAEAAAAEAAPSDEPAE